MIIMVKARRRPLLIKDCACVHEVGCKSWWQWQLVHGEIGGGVAMTLVGRGVRPCARGGLWRREINRSVVIIVVA